MSSEYNEIGVAIAFIYGLIIWIKHRLNKLEDTDDKKKDGAHF